MTRRPRLARTMAVGEPLTPPPQEDLREPLSVCDHEVAAVRRAAEVLGVDRVASWMATKIPSLGGQTPYSLLQTEEGRQQIERVLLKIEHGVY